MARGKRDRLVMLVGSSSPLGFVGTRHLVDAFHWDEYGWGYYGALAVVFAAWLAAVATSGAWLIRRLDARRAARAPHRD
jgi:hypothetical protein